MFFCTYEHYSDEQPIYYNYNKKNEVRECFVCFEIKAFNEAKPITLKNQKLYITSCNCNSFVHKKCLELWFDINKNCPICRISVRDRTFKLFIVNKLFPYGIYTIFYIINVSKRMLRIFSRLFFIYLFVKYYITHKIFFYEKIDYLYDLNEFNNTSSY